MNHSRECRRDRPWGNTFVTKEKRRQLTIEELHEKTGIHLTSLHALEHDMRQELPADVFVRGFIKLYAKTLELDPQNALAPFPWQRQQRRERAGSLARQRPSEQRESGGITPVHQEKTAASVSCWFCLAFWRMSSIAISPCTDLKLFPIVNSVPQTAPFVKVNPPALLQNSPVKKNNAVTAKTEQETTIPNPPPQEFSSPGEPPPPAPETAGEAANESSPQTAVPPQPARSNNAQDKTASTENKAFHTLTATFSQMTWVRTVIDHEETKEAFFRPGTSASWQAKENIEMVLGNSGGVSLVFDGSPVDLQGREGKVIRLSFP